MEARLVAMEQLVGRLTTEVETFWKGTTNELGNDAKPNNSEHVGSKNTGGEGDTGEEMKVMPNELHDLKGKYEEMARKMSTL